MDISKLYALLEEVDGLLARIDSTLPLAHLAPHYAALARHALETALVYTDCPVNTTPLKLLRAIAHHISLEAAAGDIDVMRLMLENGAPIDEHTFIHACTKGQTEIVRFAS